MKDKRKGGIAESHDLLSTEKGNLDPERIFADTTQKLF